MKIGSTNYITFGKKFYGIDMHVHDKGIDNLKEAAVAEDLTIFVGKSFQLGNDEFVLKTAIPSSLSGVIYNKEKLPYEDEMTANKNIIKTYQNTPIKSYYAVCQPKETVGNPVVIEKLLKEEGCKFVGLKFHPESAELEADSILYDKYLKLAEEKNLPCLFHSDRSFDTEYKYTLNGEEHVSLLKRSNFSRPDQIYELSKRHPKVPIIIGHLGGPEAGDVSKAIDVIIESARQQNGLLYADISWVDADRKEKPNLIEAIRRLKSEKKNNLIERLMFGSDAPLDRFSGKDGERNYRQTIIDIYNAIKKSFGVEAEDIFEKIFSKNAEKLFFQKNKNNIIEPTKKTKTQNKKTIQKAIIEAKSQNNRYLLPIIITTIGGGILAFWAKNRFSCSDNTHLKNREKSIIV